MQGDGGGVGECGDVGEGFPGFGEQDDDVGFAGGLDGALDAKLFYAVGGGAQAGGVYEAEGYAVELYGVFDEVAGGALYVGDDGAFLVEECVEECAFAYVWGADDGYGDAFLQGVAGVEGGCQAADVGVDGVGEGGEFGAVGELEVFVV